MTVIEKSPRLNDQQIREAILDHQRWLRSRGGRKADLSFCDLSSFALAGVNLSSAKFSGANLAKANLRGTNLSNADLFGADLEACDLTDANLVGADLRGANLNRCLLTNANMRGADLRAGQLQTADGSNSQRGGATTLVEAQLNQSILIDAHLNGADLTGADLSDADLSGAELTRTVLLGADLSGAVLKGAILAKTVVMASALETTKGCALTAGAIAEPDYIPMTPGAFLAAVTSHEQWAATGGKVGRRLDLDLVVVPPIAMSGRTLSGSRLRRCRFVGGSWRRVTLQMADLSYSDLQGIDLSGADLRGTSFRRANLASANLAGVNAGAFPLADGRSWPTNFDAADLRGIDLTDATLDDSILSIAITEPTPTPTTARSADQERRRHRRYRSSGLSLLAEGEDFRSLDWSIGGMRLRGGGHLQAGARIQGTLMLNDPPCAADDVELIVIDANPRKGTFSVQFDGHNQALKRLLHAAYTRATQS
ncbi:MAG: pentapeptide repeat-containing protein [Azospirillaceae bacterium]|nr:pentapeptide repeat-containing protein [Azospirillaceae bacterium]